MAEKKIKCLVNGRTVTLTEQAFKLAKRHFGAISEDELQRAKPVELQKPLIKPTIKPVILKPPIKEIPEVKVPESDPMTEVKPEEPDASGDPVAEKKVKKVPVKRKK